jgi:phosphoglycolate phosphatase-like HAD superfamily hydrolase
MKVLALDFDGVISHSATESFVVALRTYTAMRPDSGLVASAGDLRDAPRDTVRQHPVYCRFVELMPLGNRAEDFAVALWAIEQGVPLHDQAAYTRERDAQPADFLDAFHENFYRARVHFEESDQRRWLALLGPYPEFVALLERRAGDAQLALATAKDRRSIDILLRHYGLAELLPAERVLDKEMGRSKRAHLTALQARTGVAFEEITFVDDKVNHLDDVAGLGVRCALAAWGYNGEREQEIARERGYLVCTLEDVEARLFDHACD